MATTGKKINELDQISTVTSQTVLPAVYVNNGTPANTATKMTLAQVKDYIELNATPASTTNLGPVKVDGDTITIGENNVISSHSGIDATAAAHAAMPSEVYDELEPPVFINVNAEKTFTAPADGYYAWGYRMSSGTASQNNLYNIGLYAFSPNDMRLYGTCMYNPCAEAFLSIILPVKKGMKVIASVYGNKSSNDSFNFFHFIYAVGSESEYNESN